jgi:hypothetical protein
MKNILTISLLAVLVLTACKKDKAPAPSLKGIWTIENFVTKEYMSGALNDTFTSPGNGGTIDFQSNGNVVITIPGSAVETYAYTIKPDSKVDIDGDIYEIRNLTASNATLFIRQDYGVGDYDEVSVNLKS